MRISSLEHCIEEYNIFDEQGDPRGPSSDFKREKKLKDFPFSVITEGEYGENDQAEKWCTDTVGIIGKSWVKSWYYKTNYNYGFWEYFFKAKSTADFFASSVPTFYFDYTSKG